MKKYLVTLLLFVSLSLVISGTVLAETETEKFLNSFTIDLPPAKLSCRTGGVLSNIFLKTPLFETHGNAFFYDKETQTIAFFQHAEVINTDFNNKKIETRVLVKVPSVQKGDISDLLLEKRLVASPEAEIVFVAKVLTDEGLKVYVYDSHDEDGNLIKSPMVTKIRRLGSIRYNGQKFIAGDPVIKIYLPIPPKLVAKDGSLIDVFGDLPGRIICQGRGVAIHDFDLEESGFDKIFGTDFVEAIITEANNNDLTEEDGTSDEFRIKK